MEERRWGGGGRGGCGGGGIQTFQGFKYRKVNKRSEIKERIETCTRAHAHTDTHIQALHTNGSKVR